jgi:hypothetical protein
MPREDGAIIVDGQQLSSTLQCCHCGNHFEVVRGSGRSRGFCLRCGDVTCGAPECVPCVPFEAVLEHMEGRRTPYTGMILER